MPDGDVTLKRTACIAWDTDLAALLESLGRAKAVSLLCMTPGWCSSTGQWAARDVREVWTARNPAGDQPVLLRDEHGREFGDPSRLTSTDGLTDRRLVLRLGHHDVGRGDDESESTKAPAGNAQSS